jgi:hypothetical protein
MSRVIAKTRRKRAKTPARGGTATPNGGSRHAKVSEGRFDTVMQAAARSGLLQEKSSRIAGRVSPTLVKQAKKRTGIEADSDLIAFALASVALEDDFAEAFKDARGKVDARMNLGL